MALMRTTGLAQDIVSAAVRAEFNRATEEQSSELYYQNLGLTDSFPDVPAEQINGITGPGAGVLTIEGQQFFSNTKYREYPVTATLRKYTSELSWSDEDIYWLQKANESSKRVIDFTQMSSQAVQALNQNVNVDACKVFYLGFGTTFLSVGNSESLFGTHTLVSDGSTVRNTFPATEKHYPLSTDAVAEAITLMNRFKAQNGIQELKVNNLKLIVPPELEPLALRIRWSDYGPTNTQLGYQAAGPTITSKMGTPFEVVVARDIPGSGASTSYATYWFLVDMKRAARRAFMYWAWKPKLNEHPDYRKGIWYNDASTIFGPVVQGWQWAFGSKGDNSTPS